MEFGVTMSHVSCQDTGESSSQPSGIIAMVAISQGAYTLRIHEILFSLKLN